MPPGEWASGAEIGGRIRELGLHDQTAALDALAVRAQGGDLKAREELVVRALPLVARQAKRYAGRDLDIGDLVQEGVIGLLRALERYDPQRGVPFAAYAGWWMRQAMQQAVAEQSRAVRLPTRVLWDLHDLREAREHTADPGSDERVARSLGWNEGRVADVLRAARPALSLDVAYEGDRDAVTPLGDLIADP